MHEAFAAQVLSNLRPRVEKFAREVGRAQPLSEGDQES
jgi:hypothetical protein